MKKDYPKNYTDARPTVIVTHTIKKVYFPTFIDHPLLVFRIFETQFILYDNYLQTFYLLYYSKLIEDKSNFIHLYI